MSILFATNFSEAAQAAASAAALLAARAGRPLVLVHVLPPESVRAFGRPLMEAAQGALEAEALRLERLGARVERRLLMGAAPDEVARLAREAPGALVVTAAPTREPPYLGVGGTVDRLVLALTRPLLVVREAAPFEAWARGERPLKVLLGVDRSAPSEAARDWVKALRALGPVDLVAARVFWPQEEYPRLGVARPLVSSDVTDELRQALAGEVDALVAPLREGGAPVRTRVEPGVGRIADHLVAVAREEAVDLLVVGTHHRRALAKMWSVSHHALRLAPMSVACVPAEAASHGAGAEVPALREVLATTDFSEAGSRAVPYAFSLVPRGGTVHLVYVGEPGADEAQVRQWRERLAALVPEAARRPGVQVRTEVVLGGDVPGAIAQAAERFNVDVVCMGTHGHTGLRRVVLGSVTQRVMERTDRPVLTVRPPRA